MKKTVSVYSTWDNPELRIRAVALFRISSDSMVNSVDFFAFKALSNDINCRVLNASGSLISSVGFMENKEMVQR